MNRQLKVLFKEQGNIVHSVSGDASIKKAVGIMNKYLIGALMVLNFDGDIEGIITEKDVMKKLASTDDLVGHLPVHSIMTPREKLIIGSGNDTIDHLMNVMTENNIRHIPIIDEDGVLQGILSMRDIIKILLEDTTQKVRYLNDYIMGRYPA